ncbi:hypothetical protein ACROYT_G022820 [Oculina patagonica]
MGWKEKGKYGVSTGRTVRSPFADIVHGYSSYLPGSETEILLKFTRGTEKFSSSEMDEFLAENDIEDGLGDFAETSKVPFRAANSVHLSSIPYSLKKRKRWTLSERAVGNSVELNDSEERPNVTFVHRRMGKGVDADCIAIQKTNQNEVFTPRNRKYTRIQDLLKKCDSNELEPEVGYEISYRHPTNEYPECCESNGTRWRWSAYWSLRNPRKARSKNKGIKNKCRDRWDMYSDGEVKSGKITNFNHQPCYCESYQYNHHKAYMNTECKVQVMDAGSFSEWEASDKRSCSGGASFDLGGYIAELTKHPRSLSKKPKQRKGSGCSNQGHSLNGTVKYGKKSAIYIDPDPNSNLCQNHDAADSSPSVASKPQILQPEKKTMGTLLLNADDVEPRNLKSQFNGLYTEANSLPRKFTIDLMLLLSTEGSISCETCCVLCELTNKTDNGLCTALTDVSLHVSGTGDLDTDSNFICNAITKFYSKIESAKQDIWSVRDVVDYALTQLQECSQPSQYATSTSNSLKHVKTWRCVEALGSMFGWKSEICTQSEIKSELRLKIKEQRTHRMNDQLDVMKTVELMDKFCGICYEDLGNQMPPPFTALKHCCHVFCNECWEIHLKTQISLGNTDLQCPGYKCEVCVDDVTILALVPSLYDKYLSLKVDKALEANLEVRWCPSTACGHVLRAAASTCSVVANENSPISVACVCGGLWCFQCGRQAHWPASCSGDEKFHEVTEHFFTELELNKEELITSVMVRNCPNCRYPIEKHLGCNFMYCIMCQTAFCWECLTPMGKHKDGCKQHMQSKEVELDLTNTGTNHFAKYFAVYSDNKKARSSKAMSHQRQKLRTVDKSMACYKSLSLSCAYFNEVMENMLQSDCPEILRSATEFKYYAHLTLEGAAKMAIVSKSSCRGLKQQMERLQFIVEIVGELAKSDITQLSNQKHLSKLSAFVHRGKNCVFTIAQVLANSWD